MLAPISLRRAREQAGLSREALARRAQISVRTLYRIEHGLTTPRRPTTIVIAMALGRRPADIAWPSSAVDRVA
jgi:transcriptional regulator with XRE-family HTH domain